MPRAAAKPSLFERERAACPYADSHTEGPPGYMQWHEWAAEMSADHEQKLCPGCGYFTLVVPKSARVR